MKESKIVTFMRFNQIGRAEIVKSLLEANGIKVDIVHDTIQSVLPNLSSGGSPILLIMEETEVEKANEIISANFDKDEFEAETGTKLRKKK